MQKYTVLCYLDKPTGRDAEILIPIIYAAEKYLNCIVTPTFIWDIYAIKRNQPDLVLLPNIKGHHMYFEIAKYCYQNKVKVFALESEGNFKTDGSFPYWGYNVDKFFYQEWVNCWSQRTQSFVQELAPEQKEKVVLTGGSGFDRYLICAFEKRQSFLSRYKLTQYKKVIGYAGWAFGKIYSQHKETALLYIHSDRKERFAWVESHRKFVRDILRTTIENNPDTLFIFKRHPRESFESDIKEGLNEMNELLDYDNVLYIRNEEDVHDLINISDIWLGFETTTALEAWMMGKQTLLINDNKDFTRGNLHIGSVKVDNSRKLQAYIDEFYAEGSIADFKDPQLEHHRNDLIKESIGFADGLNHIRCAYFLNESLAHRSKKEPIKFNLRHIRLYLLMHLGKYFFIKSIFKRLPYFKKTIYVFENMYLKGFKERMHVYFDFLDSFHTMNPIQSELQKGNWVNVLGEEFFHENKNESV